MAAILIVDDEPGVREFMADALGGGGDAVFAAADGHEALVRLEERPYDLMILDLRMPGPDGMEVLRRARARHPRMGVIVSTGHGGVPDAVEAIKLGAFDFVQKPLESPDALRRLADRALRWSGTPAAWSGAAGPDEAAPRTPQPAAGSGRLGYFLAELRRRRVYRVAAAYGAAAFIGLQVAQLVLPALPLPGWTYSALVVATIAGFPVAAALGWIYDIEENGVRRTARRPRTGDPA